MKGTVLLVGLGSLGGPLLDRLATEPAIERLVACSRSARRGAGRCNLARLTALICGHEPRIDFRAVDLEAAGELARVIEEARPEIVIQAASLHSWWPLELLPEAAAKPLRAAGFGAWLPMHLKLPLAFAAELERAAYEGVVLNGSYPDVINCVLGHRGRAPTSGIGNLDEVVPKVRLLAAERLGSRAADVDVLLVAHHALEAASFAANGAEVSGTPPFFVRVEHGGRDVSGQVEAERLVLAAFPLATGPAWGTLTAASAGRLVRALLADDEERLHAPGPAGLPGGYPVRVSRGHVAVAEIPGLTLEEAIAINEASHRFDGIDRIEDDGAVIFSATTSDILRRTLGHEADRLTLAEVPERADDLLRRVRRYAEQNGVDWSRVTELR